MPLPTNGHKNKMNYQSKPSPAPQTVYPNKRRYQSSQKESITLFTVVEASSLATCGYKHKHKFLSTTGPTKIHALSNVLQVLRVRKQASQMVSKNEEGQ